MNFMCHLSSVTSVLSCCSPFSCLFLFVLVVKHCSWIQVIVPYVLSLVWSSPCVIVFYCVSTCLPNVWFSALVLWTLPSCQQLSYIVCFTFWPPVYAFQTELFHFLFFSFTWVHSFHVLIISMCAECVVFSMKSCRRISLKIRFFVVND